MSAQQKIGHNCVLEDILINVENQNEKIRKLEKSVEKQNKEFQKRIEELEERCLMTDVIQTKYQMLDNRYKDLVHKLSSLGIIIDSEDTHNCNKSY